MLKLMQKALNLRPYAFRRYVSLTHPKRIDDRHIIHPPDNSDIKIRQYEAPRGESLDVQRSRLVYQSRKRAILENDLLLSNFAHNYLKKFNKRQLDAFDKLINMARNDWDIYYWMTGKEPTPAEFQSDVMDLLKKYVENNTAPLRIRQPDL